MTSKKYTYYPGCSSEGSGSHLHVSTTAVAEKLGIELVELDDWNCCGASVAHVDGGYLPTVALSARNLALASGQGDQDIFITCAACYLKSHQANEKIRGGENMRGKVNDALGAAGMSYDGGLSVRHACEVFVNDIGLDAIKKQVSNPLDGLKVAGYVGCQTVRPFANTERGGNFDTYDDPSFLDDFIEACGAEAVEFDNKTSCCGGAIALMSPDKSMGLIKNILEEAKQKEADCIATPCPLCQQNVEMYQDMINKEFGTGYQIPVVFHTQIMAVAFGLDANKDAALDRNTIAADKLTKIANKN
ncbi:MAG TPA: heterodisulfide reductase [Rhodospirillales bacterium]|nr:heterodisulfide reductase [Rhodospirillales bacterium]